MQLTATQVRWFRFRRSGLAEPFDAIETAAERLLGIQAQLLPAAHLALWNRVAGCSLAEIEDARLTRRSIVRFWGPRNTLHLFRTTAWPLLNSAFSELPALLQGRLKDAGLLRTFTQLVARTRRRLADGHALTHKDVTSKALAEGQDRWVVSYVTFMTLVREGVVCHGADRGKESTFVHRQRWVPQLAWNPPGPAQAHADLTLLYLGTYGPATDRDLAFWYGTNLTTARRWIESAGDRCTAVTVDGQQWWCRTGDLAEVAESPPPGSRWPVRLLYRFDPLLLAHKDKSWLVDDADYKKVWRAAAHVEAVILVGGRIAGTWRYDRSARGVTVTLAPFKQLSAAVNKQVRRQATRIAQFLELPLVDCVT